MSQTCANFCPHGDSDGDAQKSLSYDGLITGSFRPCLTIAEQ